MAHRLPSLAWRGPRGAGKRTALLKYLSSIAKNGIEFKTTLSTWFLTKQTTSQEDDADDDSPEGKTIPYEYSSIHLAFDCARMSMSDKVFIQSILKRWTGQQDLTLANTTISNRYLVLFHAHLLADESVLQLQEALEQYDDFALLITTEQPVCQRLRDYCLEIPVPGPDHLLINYCKSANLPCKDVWLTFFINTLNIWASAPHNEEHIIRIRQWIYTCLQRNLRWPDLISYWIDAINTADYPWLGSTGKRALLKILSRAESGGGWTLITSYRIPILWEQLHLELANNLSIIRKEASASEK